VKIRLLRAAKRVRRVAEPLEVLAGGHAAGSAPTLRGNSLYEQRFALAPGLQPLFQAVGKIGFKILHQGGSRPHL